MDIAGVSLKKLSLLEKEISKAWKDVLWFFITLLHFHSPISFHSNKYENCRIKTFSKDSLLARSIYSRSTIYIAYNTICWSNVNSVKLIWFITLNLLSLINIILKPYNTIDVGQEVKNRIINYNQTCHQNLLFFCAHIILLYLFDRRLTLPLERALCLARLCLMACLEAAATGQPDRLRCVVRLELTWPRPLQPGVGHFRMVSCIAKTTAGRAHVSL